MRTDEIRLWATETLGILVWNASGGGRLGLGDTPGEALEMWQEDCKERPWPEEEDCPGCPAHKDGPHKMSCVGVK